ncbi:hypothetical protein Tdes44962_MAKER08093 [Teratosphaeria destructans]|uniref:Uncharacterized protein n=1 Tax=Teratosphaeria destructans TaxID=418781 RepID=A0A9W7SXP1_9PEZI|nr:hypothetical protein Tdes44962_MAKER08093 [Teratosphaeria destructans]
MTRPPPSPPTSTSTSANLRQHLRHISATHRRLHSSYPHTAGIPSLAPADHARLLLTTAPWPPSAQLEHERAALFHARLAFDAYPDDVLRREFPSLGTEANLAMVERIPRLTAHLDVEVALARRVRVLRWVVWLAVMLAVVARVVVAVGGLTSPRSGTPVAISTPNSTSTPTTTITTPVDLPSPSPLDPWRQHLTTHPSCAALPTSLQSATYELLTSLHALTNASSSSSSSSSSSNTTSTTTKLTHLLLTRLSATTQHLVAHQPSVVWPMEMREYFEWMDGLDQVRSRCVILAEIGGQEEVVGELGGTVEAWLGVAEGCADAYTG